MKCSASPLKLLWLATVFFQHLKETVDDPCSSIISSKSTNPSNPLNTRFCWLAPECFDDEALDQKFFSNSFFFVRSVTYFLSFVRIVKS